MGSDEEVELFADLFFKKVDRLHPVRHRVGIRLRCPLLLAPKLSLRRAALMEVLGIVGAKAALMKLVVESGEVPERLKRLGVSALAGISGSQDPFE